MSGDAKILRDFLLKIRQSKIHFSETMPFLIFSSMTTRFIDLFVSHPHPAARSERSEPTYTAGGDVDGTPRHNRDEHPIPVTGLGQMPCILNQNKSDKLLLMTL